MRRWVQIHEKDNVAVALVTMEEGTRVTFNGSLFETREEIPKGHKFALQNLPKDGEVIKYGSVIGRLKTDVSCGGWIHTHNLQTTLSAGGECVYQPEKNEAEDGAHKKGFGTSREKLFFEGYLRPDGRVGTRNELWIIPTVGCVNEIAEKLARDFEREKASGVDCVTAFTHPYGCSQMGEDQENTRRVLASLIRHPNAGGVLVLGLGCENSNIEVLKGYIGEYDKERVRFLSCQETGDELGAGMEALRELNRHAGAARREKTGVDKLVVGLKCGGSDGLSGITANPVVGRFSDLFLLAGGATILTEVPEMFGAERQLMNRCKDEETCRKAVELVRSFQEYFLKNGQTIYENPSPGNKKGGISTLEDKSLGCVQKSGSAKVEGILRYGEMIQGPGLHLLSAPGNDLVSATALAASGAQVIVFTTGRGTPFASPVPTIKISSNTDVYQKKRHWIDFDAGGVVREGSVEESGENLLRLVLRVASGEYVQAEKNGFHGMAIWKQGVTM